MNGRGRLDGARSEIIQGTRGARAAPAPLGLRLGEVGRS